MPIRIESVESTGKRWAPKVTASKTGLAFDAFDALIGNRLGYTEFEVPKLTVPCTAPGVYYLAVCRTNEVVLVDESLELPTGLDEAFYFAEWTLAEGQTCVDVEIVVQHRVLAERPPTVMDVPVYETRPKLGDDGEPLVDDDGAPVTKTVEVGTEQVTVPPEPLPEPTRHVVSSTLVLPRARTAQERFDAIDAKTRERIAQGVVFKGVRCSLSIEAQMRMLGACVAAQTLAYPIAWNSLDDTEVLSLDNAGEVLEFYGAGMQALRDAVDVGTVLKDAVRAELEPKD